MREDNQEEQIYNEDNSYVEIHNEDDSYVEIHNNKNGDKRAYYDNEGNSIDEKDFVIAPMNVEGMPWYNEHGDRIKRNSNKGDYSNISKLTRKEEMMIMWGSIKAGLLVALVFSLVLVLFVLFCVFIWF